LKYNFIKTHPRTHKHGNGYIYTGGAGEGRGNYESTLQTAMANSSKPAI